MFLMIDIPTMNYLMLEDCGEASCYEEAMTQEDNKVECAMQSEMNALWQNKRWDLISLPKDSIII